MASYTFANYSLMVVAVVAAEAMGTMWVEATAVVLIGMMDLAQMVGGGEERIHPEWFVRQDIRFIQYGVLHLWRAAWW